MKFRNLAVLTLVAAALAACGGGGGDAPAPIAAGPADKYVGTWSMCEPIIGAVNGVVSARIDFVFAKTAPTTMSMAMNGIGFSAANCTGNEINPQSGLATAAVTINGTKLVGTDTVDRLDIVGVSQSIPVLNGAYKDLGFVSGNTLKFGGAVTDAQGYPTSLDHTTVFTKR